MKSLIKTIQILGGIAVATVFIAPAVSAYILSTLI